VGGVGWGARAMSRTLVQEALLKTKKRKRRVGKPMVKPKRT